MSPLWRAVLGLTLGVAIIEGLFLIGLARQVGGILLRLGPSRAGQTEGGPEVGTVPEFALHERGRPAIVAFVSPHCEACKDLPPAFKAVQRNYPEVQLLVAVTGQTPQAKREYATKLGPIADIDLEELYELWNVDGTPFVVGLDTQGRVTNTGVVNNLEHLEAFAQDVITASFHKHVHDGEGSDGQLIPETDLFLESRSTSSELEGAR
jgi:thiol-disulfide isomerase/thioredoxin